VALVGKEEAREELEVRVVLEDQVVLEEKVVLGALVLAREAHWRNRRSHCTLF